jgi:hypothetical protein|tara:strand:- start:675 stop:920 length:246 start_codon:yes stop_codon:yes gene_type:complete
MIEVFITDIQTKVQADKVFGFTTNSFPNLKMNFDLKEEKKQFPCGHTVLRVEGEIINSEKIISELNKLGFKCEILEDKICA